MNSPNPSLPSILTMPIHRQTSRNNLDFQRKDQHLLDSTSSPRGSPPCFLQSPNNSHQRRFFSPSSPLKILHRKNKMSVTEPADSGSDLKTAQQTLQVCDQIEEIDHQIGSWAQMMEEDEPDLLDLCGGTDQVDGSGTPTESPERRRPIPEEPPFKVQITNISSQHCEEELIYYFGGDTIKHVEFRKEDGNADFEFDSKQALLNALTKHDVEFKGRILKVFVIRQPRQTLAAGKISSRYSRNYESSDSHFSQRRHDSYQGGRSGSHYNSQSSLNSESHKYGGGRFDKGNRNYSNHYGTMPAGGYHQDRRGDFAGNNNRGGYNNGGYNNSSDNNRNNFRAPRNPAYYDRQYSHPNNHRNEEDQNGGPLQRSGSYQHYRYQGGGPRSRTESGANFDSFSRTSSRMSLSTTTDEAANTTKSKAPAPNPFGDAKPVDTQARLLELEKREAEKKAAAAQAAKKTTVSTTSVTTAKSSDEQGDVASNQQNQQGEDQATPSASGNTASSSSSTSHPRYGGYAPRGGHQRHQNHQYSGGHRGYHQQNQQNWDQGAHPGSVVIKKRESMEIVKDDDTPPADPIQYHQADETKNTTSSESAADVTAPAPPTSSSADLPPQPPTSSSSSTSHQNQNFRNPRGARPSMKTYQPRGGGYHNLQKSATVGNIDASKNQKTSKAENSESTAADVSTSVSSSSGIQKTSRRGGYGDSHQRGGYQHQQNRFRRTSLSGSESGRGGGASGKRGGASRGGRGGARRNDSRKESREENQTKNETTVKTENPVTTTTTTSEKKQVAKKEEKQKEEKPSTSSAEAPPPPAAAKTSSENDGKGDESGQTSTPKKKKEKKKDKKKEAQQSQLGDNKYAALINCNE